MSESLALRLLRLSYCAFIAWASLQTFLDAHFHHDIPVLVLSGVETIAIAAFLFARLEAVACAILLAVYATAAALTVAAHQDLPLRFVYFSMTAIYIVFAKRKSAFALTSSAESFRYVRLPPSARAPSVHPQAGRSNPRSA